MKRATIIGGGVSGLALAILLRKQNVPVVLHEAGDYPRHRVCGEFLSLRKIERLQDIGLGFLLSEGTPLASTAWWDRGQKLGAWNLPESAIGLSRYRMDALLAREAGRLGAEVHVRSRFTGGSGAGIIRSTGRPPSSGGWVGVKAHFSGLKLEADLEMHLGRQGYVGLNRIEQGLVNVCGIFRRIESSEKSQLLIQCCNAAGLGHLAERLAGASMIEASQTTTAGVALGWTKGNADCAVGDAAAVIPPLTGHGMGMAIEGAMTAAPIVAQFYDGRLSWADATAAVRKSLARRFSWRMWCAIALHHALERDALRSIFRSIAASGLFPWKEVYLQLR